MERLNPTPEVPAKHGAPMGRAENHKPATGAPFRLQMIDIDSGGYDPGGAYWGIGEPLFFYTDGGTEAFIRAPNRERAKERIREWFPTATFEPMDAESYDIDSMVNAYLTAALWSSCDDNDSPMDSRFDNDDIAPDSVAMAREDCERFVADNADDLAELDAPQAGHDLWLTRCGHGAGFWDRGLGDVGERLSDSARAFGERYVVEGDDGLLYIE